MITDVPPAPPRHHRGFLGLDRERRGPALAILAVALALAVGLPVVNHFVPGEDEIPPGTAVEAGLGVSVMPAGGWNLDVSKPRTNEVVLTQGPVKVSVKPEASNSSAEDVLAQLEREAGRKDGVQILGERETIQTTSGLTGLMRGFLSDEAQGIVAVLIAGGDDQPGGRRAIRITAEGPTGTFLAHQPEVLDLIRAIRIQGEGTP